MYWLDRPISREVVGDEKYKNINNLSIMIIAYQARVVFFGVFPYSSVDPTVSQTLSSPLLPHELMFS